MTKHDYLRHTDFDEELDFKRLRFIVKALQEHSHPGARILDVGCGNGNISRALGSLGYVVVGIDVCEASIQSAIKKNEFANVHFEVTSAEDIPTSQKFDVIVCSEVLEHLKCPTHLTETISHILALGGVLIATVPNGWGPRETLVTQPVQWLNGTSLKKLLPRIKKTLGYRNGTLQSQAEDLTHIQFFTRKSITNLIKPYGFSLTYFGHSDFIEHVFPYSILTRRLRFLQTVDMFLADQLPSFMVSGFHTVWIRHIK